MFRTTIFALSSIALAAAAMPACAADVTAQRLLDAAKEPQNWLMVHRDYDNSRHSPLSGINRGAIQSDAVTLRIFVMRVIGCHLRASRFWPRWPNRPPNRRFDG